MFASRPRRAARFRLPAHWRGLTLGLFLALILAALHPPAAHARTTDGQPLSGATADLFVDADNVDYHLSAGAKEAIDQGVELAEGGLDLDGFPHDVGLPDLGAYEWQ